MLESIAALFFSWWYLLFDQGNSLLKIEKAVQYLNPTKLEITLLTTITLFYILIFAYSCIISLLGLFVYIPVISESAMMWTKADFRYRNLKNRYSKDKSEKFFYN